MTLLSKSRTTSRTTRGGTQNDSRGESNPFEPSSAKPGRVYACDKDGSNLELLIEGPLFINGIGFTPDDERLYYSETMTPHQMWRIPFSTPFDPTRAAPAFQLQGGFPDGFAFDTAGNVWVTATVDHSIQVFSPDGELVHRLELPDGTSPSNLCFGGEDLRSLYITAAGLEQVLVTTVDATGAALHDGSV